MTSYSSTVGEQPESVGISCRRHGLGYAAVTMAPYNNAPGTGTRSGRSANRGAGAGALVGGALFVSVIALCALFIAYEGIYRLAAIVHADSSLPLAHVFPVTFTLLVLMAFWVSYLLRAAPPRERLWIDVGLIPLLILSAAVPMVVTRTEWFGRLGDTLPRGLTVVVAVAPLAALLVAFLLWIAVRAHVRRRGVQALPRPKPSDDRTTVLRGAPRPRPVPEEKAPEASEALKTRLLRLGGEPEPDQEHEASRESYGPDEWREGSDETERGGLLATRGPASNRERDEQGEEGERPGWFDHETSTETVPDPWDPSDEGKPTKTPSHDTAHSEPEGLAVAASEPNEPEPSAAPLPRRTRIGDNPIKRAATEAPVVPGAAAPEPEPARSTNSYARTWDTHHGTEEGPSSESEHSVQEGFVHEPDIGDPSSDEAEAPQPLPRADPPTTDVEAEPVEVAKRSGELPGVRLFFPERTHESLDADGRETDGGQDPDGRAKSVEEVDPSPEGPARTSAETPIESVSASTTDESDTGEDADPPNHGPLLWEPPSDVPRGSALDDYVPPVWTPPEDDTPASRIPGSSIDTGGERTDPVAGLALDHDTGPTVRAAFRLSSTPPGSAHPERDPRPRAGLVTEESSPNRRTDSPDVPEEEPGLSPDTKETADGPATEPERAMERQEEPWQAAPSAPIRRAEPLEKRPMVLKPPRPPMPDLASGPPSRRVRSEPLPPEDG